MFYLLRIQDIGDEIGRLCDSNVPAALDLAAVSESLQFLWSPPALLTVLSFHSLSQVTDTPPQGQTRGRPFACSTRSWGSH